MRCALTAAMLPFAGATLFARNVNIQPAISQAAGPNAKAVLLFFVASDCQVSNRYFPEMERLQAEFLQHGVVTFFVYSNAGEQRSVVNAHQRAYGSSVESVWMDVGDVAELAGATTSPEAALLVRDGARWRLVYVGRIDDRYVHIGLERTTVQHHDVENAVQAMLTSKPVPAPGGPPVGCSLMLRDSSQRGAEGPR